MKICNDSRGFDKILHFIAGAVICLVVGCVVAHIPPHAPWLTAATAMAAVALIAAIKELRDARKSGNHFCTWDFLYTVAGGFAMSWLPWLAAYLLAIEG